MNSLTEAEKRELLKLIEAEEPLPEKWRGRADREVTVLMMLNRLL